ncbi:uncharacterized protein LAJ45_09257 [Morchella importuna]|uniref:5-formyltetrahydrofolate cyclo-ligase n=1 Tax=Morchella conica CCBAS932 TaxID=1392247 RepID=A0A3N4KGI9_9PEZI|nr:uncharacterized protein LAJ45_09257 [Morchella importuna]KAH8146575.1 hypothetical protein LAJ45_09257 [Morchella importuna]RPB07481.1 nagb/rpia/CoA transferase-like protein [Morchella conica CCBAS932]
MTTRSVITTAKRQLRSSVKKTILSLPAENILSQSQICVNTLLSLPEYQSSRRISIFLSMPMKEVDTSCIVEDALIQEKMVHVPYIHRQSKSSLGMVDPASVSSPPNLMDMLSLFSQVDYESLEPDSWGIPTIPEHSVPGRSNCLDHEGLDLIVMPGVAFDEGFRRLGHGKGYYDYFLARYKQLVDSKGAEGKMRMPILVALALKEQIFEDGTVPVNLSDWPMDIIITGEGKLLRR